MDTKMTKFLETITDFGNDVLVPINRIKFVNFSYKENGHEIQITSEDGTWIECFEKDEKKANCRYRMIKNILEAK
jgi:hypothetical protein